MNAETVYQLERLRNTLIRATEQLGELLQDQWGAPLPPADLESHLDELLTPAACWQASHLYRHFPGRSRRVAASLRRRGWVKVRRDKGMFWLPPC